MFLLIISIAGYHSISSYYPTSVECYQAMHRQTAFFRSQGKSIIAARCIPVLTRKR